MTAPILHHNLIPAAFVWLFAKYVRTVNPAQHCTNVLHGPYSRKLSKHNAQLAVEPPLVLDEEPPGSYRAIYLCGVAVQGYRQKLNYPHNLHTAILPEAGAHDVFEFERWRLEIDDGRFLTIPGEAELPREYADLPPEFTTCRIFRWAVCSGVPPCKSFLER